MALQLVTGPTIEPVTLDRVKEHLRLDATTEDALLAGYLASARELVEKVFGRVLMTQTWDLFLDAVPESDSLEVPLPPLQSVTGVYYTALAAAEATFAAASYSVDAVSTPGRIVLNSGYSWPSSTLVVVNGFRVRFVAGYASAAAVPRTVAQAILLTVGYSYEQREALKELPVTVERLLWLDRVVPV